MIWYDSSACDHIYIYEHLPVQWIIYIGISIISSTRGTWIEPLPPGFTSSDPQKMGENSNCAMLDKAIWEAPVSSNVAGRWKIPELNGGLNERFICKWWIFQLATFDDTGMPIEFLTLTLATWETLPLKQTSQTTSGDKSLHFLLVTHALQSLKNQSYQNHNYIYTSVYIIYTYLIYIYIYILCIYLNIC